MKLTDLQEAQYADPTKIEDPIKFVLQVLKGQRMIYGGHIKVENTLDTIAQLAQKFGEPDDTEDNGETATWRSLRSPRGREYYVDVFKGHGNQQGELHVTH